MSQQYNTGSEVLAAKLILPRLIPLKEVMLITGLARSTIYKKIQEGSFPAPLRISAGCVRWKDTCLSTWLDNLNPSDRNHA